MYMQKRNTSLFQSSFSSSKYHSAQPNPPYIPLNFRYKTEIFSSKYRYLPINCDPAWTLGGCCIPLLSFLVPNWRHYCAIVFVFPLLVVPAVALMPESPAWLVQQGRLDEAYEVSCMDYIVELNCLKIDAGHKE